MKTPSSISSFILAMVLFPHVQDKAQKEIDSVIGKDRLPRFTDRESLPYINAIVKELLRWNPSVPLGRLSSSETEVESTILINIGLPHELQQEDVYRDYYLPKGSIVWANIW